MGGAFALPNKLELKNCFDNYKCLKIDSKNFKLFAKKDNFKQYIYLQGIFYFGDFWESDRLFQFLDKNKPTVLNLNFGGGFFMPIESFIKELKRKAGKRNITTIVTNGQKCSSFCILMMMAGENRVAEKLARFGFHSANIFGMKAPGQAENFYRKHGVSRNWLKTNKKLFDSKKMTYLYYNSLGESNILTNPKFVSRPLGLKEFLRYKSLAL